MTLLWLINTSISQLDTSNPTKLQIIISRRADCIACGSCEENTRSPFLLLKIWNWHLIYLEDRTGFHYKAYQSMRKEMISLHEIKENMIIRKIGEGNTSQYFYNPNGYPHHITM